MQPNNHRDDWRTARAFHLRKLAAELASEGDIDASRDMHREADRLLADPPPVLGGQGRAADAVRASAWWTVAAVLLATALVAVVVLR